jgi:hypothetical protein
MTDDIVARLREFSGNIYSHDIVGKAAMSEAADKIERLQAIKERLLSALRVMDERAALEWEKTNDAAT